ncbi:MAG: ABC transporter ATP-binding protein [Bdellovibrionales bacterium]
MKKLWPFVRPHKWNLVLILFFGFLMSATTVGLLPFVKFFFDEVLEKKNVELKYIIPLAFPAIYLVHGAARFFHLYFLKITGERIIANVRLALQEKFMHLNLSFHGKYEAGSGGLLSRILNDMVIVQWGLNIFADIVREPITAIGLLVGMFYLDWKLTLCILLVAPLIAVTLKQLSKSIRKYSHMQQSTMEDVTSVLKETLDGVRVIQSFSLESELRRRLDVVLTDYLSHRRKIIVREEIAGPISEVVGAWVFAAICMYMADQIIGGKSSTGTFLAFVGAAALFQPPIKKLQDAYIRLQQTFAATARLFEILDDPNEVPRSEKNLPFPKDWKQIEFRNVSFSYDQRPILKNINITIQRGEVVALVGESGSGKSTLVNLLERFFEPVTGQIFIGGVLIGDINLHELRKNIALVTQDVFLFKDTIARNIQSGDFERFSKETSHVEKVVESVSQSANAHDFIRNMTNGFQTDVGERGSKLSGGEKQRVSIARAFYKDAPILILDEATSALDSTSEVEVQKGLDHLMSGRTAFVIAHRLATVSKADRIVVLKNGEIVEQGAHQDLLTKKGQYFQFYQLQTLR